MCVLQYIYIYVCVCVCVENWYYIAMRYKSLNEEFQGVVQFILFLHVEKNECLCHFQNT